MKKKFLIVSIVIIFLVISSVIFYFSKMKVKDENYEEILGEVIYIKEVETYGFFINKNLIYIYSDGVIASEYDSGNPNIKKEIQRFKISQEEIEKLQGLIDNLEDKYERNNEYELPGYEISSETQKVYKNNSEIWIQSSINNKITGQNNTEISLEIIEYTENLYNKYLKK